MSFLDLFALNCVTVNHEFLIIYVHGAFQQPSFFWGTCLKDAKAVRIRCKLREENINILVLI